MHFLEHADRKDSIPKAKGCTPKYSTWVFSDNDWNTMEIIVDVLKVCEFFPIRSQKYPQHNDNHLHIAY